MTKFVICVSGGIASGKTLVSDMLSLFGYEVIDADVVSREVVSKGAPTLAKLIACFGANILKGSGELNREKLKKIVFNNSSKLEQLNKITHPAIKNQMLQHIATCQVQKIALVIPLFDVSMFKIYDIHRLLVVDVSEELQFRRIMSRDGVDETMAKNIVAAQLKRSERNSLAADLLSNNGTVGELKSSVELLVKSYEFSFGL